MKKNAIICLILLSSSFAFAQKNYDDSIVQNNKNIITIDATYMLRQLFNFNSNSYYSNRYVIGYTRKFGRNGVRLNLGGYARTSNSITNDTIPGKNSDNSIAAALGYERYTHLAKRWSFYFGADFVYSCRIRNYQSQTSDGLYSYHEKAQTTSYGIAPLFGLMFKLNSRLEISAETNYLITYFSNKDHRYYIPSTQWDSSSSDSGIESSYFPPASILLRIHF